MLKYYIDERDNPEDAREFPLNKWESGYPSDPAKYAEMAAAWCHSHRDGWEWEWPKTFVIIRAFVEVGRYSVEREMIPEFSATPIESNTKVAQEPQAPCA